MSTKINIPTAHKTKFENGIQHPTLHLWDAWSYIENNTVHLYCLAVSRIKQDGTALKPSERNDFPFHIRHFTSENNGTSWKDEGCFLNLKTIRQKHDYHSVWSGSVKPLANGKKLVAFTGLEKIDSNHKFLQNITLAISKDGYTIDQIENVTLSSPSRDWKEITNTGYYLNALNLGGNEGEVNGPILAWRDPFIFIDGAGKINLFWGGKVAPRKSALVRAIITESNEGYKISKLFPPTTVPDEEDFTQLELPKIVYDKERNLYYLIISTCNRLYEKQPDSEVDKGVRLYKSESIEGPWESLGDKILNSEHLFGLSILKTDFENNRLLCISPYTDAANDTLSLTFAPVFYVYLDTLRVEFL